MFKVECPGCKAPYQVDERRVPPSGLKMRCPKCGTSFQVDPPPADPRAAQPAGAVLGAALGLSGEQGSENPPEAAQRPALPRRKPPLKGTMIGVAPPRSGAAGAPARPAMGAAEATAKVAVKPATPAADPFAELDLPAAIAPKPAGPKPPVPKPAWPKAAPPAADPLGDVDLPSPAAPPLPARKNAAPRPAAPVHGAPRPPLPRPAAEKPAEPEPIEEIELGDAGGWEIGAEEADLPAIGGRADLPMTAAPTRDAFADLPSSKAAAPQPGRAPANPRPARAAASAPAQPAKAAPDAFGEIDLPSVSAGGTDLPSLSTGVDLPSPSLGADLPSVLTGGRAAAHAPTMPGFGELDLPIVGGDLPVPAAGLPVPVAAGLPSPAAGLPTPSASLPIPAGGLPSAKPSPLPAVLGGGTSAAPAAADDGFSIPLTDDPFAQPLGAPAPFEIDAPPASFRKNTPDPFGGVAADPFDTSGDPFGGSGGDPFARGSLPPTGNRFEAELSEPPKSFRNQPAPSARGTGDSAPGFHAEPPAADLVREAGGGTAYGEVNLDDGGGAGVAIEGDLPEQAPGQVASEVGSEFAGLPEEVSLPNRARARPDIAAGSAAAEIQAKRKRRRVRIAVALVATLALAGGALTLVPALGPFGAYFIIDQVKHGDYERALANAAGAAQKALASDTAPDAERATQIVESAAAAARRFKPLAAYTAFVGFDRALRFGGDPSIYAKAKVTTDELADVRGMRELDLARASKAAVDGDLARARQLLDQLAQAQPKDVDVRSVRGEVELRARDNAAAVTAWKAAVDAEKSPRALYGLARATLASGDAAGAEKLVEQVLALNPHHVGARLLLAESAWTGKHDEPRATKLLDDVQKDLTLAGPEERIVTETLLGEIHMSRGRMSQAEQAFGEAIKTADQLKASALAARALSGLGETMFRAGRYSQAIARFKAAAQADPDDVQAQVGVAKSSLLLERADDARDMLGKLRKSHGNVMQVAYWYGRVTESLGDRKEAESAYRDAIGNAKGDPDAVQAYIALARVQSANGQLDAAHATLADAETHLSASPALYKALGRVAMSQGRYADGFESFQRALDLDGGDVEAKFLLGTALVRQRQFDKALEIFDAVAKIDRDFPGLALERGILFQESGRTEEALREYESALAKAPTDPDLMLKVGCGKAEAGNGAEAEKLLKKVLEQRQNSAETYFCLGRALMMKHDLGEAIKQFDRAIQLDPNHAEYYLYVGWAANDAGAIAKASTALKRALELDQGLADAYWQRGVLRVRQTRPKDAIEDLEKALELRPSRYQAHADLALAYYDLGKEDLALAEWQKAIAANPNEATWRFHYGKLLSLRLQNAAAAEQLKKAIELAEAEGGTEPWLSEAHRLAAVSLGNTPAAIPHWQAFLKTGALNSPFRNEAKAALKRLGQPWEDD
ncbi:MAG TPA: tetratricopeptide repeat protein [Polyangiaceae bacterium]|nr:tetratricopeptide repeat protein [Polyangiaceae bacterium]